MLVAWTQHRFAGGALALDLANTVVLRNRPAETFDRFADPSEINRFAEAARVFRADELGGKVFERASAGTCPNRVTQLREATDALFREAAERNALGTWLLPPFLRAVADCMDGREPDSFETALSLSALSLLAPERLARIRICASCAWLFLDRSRNGSRLWCDMAVCGNRAKARRHRLRQKGGRP